jgi:hypothetical protein
MAAILTAVQLVEFVKKAVADEWGYVWGGQGQLYTKELAEKWGKAQRSGKSNYYYTVSCARWIGHIIVDCSGLIVEAFRSVNPKYADRSSTGLFNQCVEKGAIKSIPDVPGLCVWRQGHIGVYIGGGQVIEAGGYKHGVVITPLNSPATGKAWTNWGKLRDVDYTMLPGLPDAGEGESDMNVKDKTQAAAWQSALIVVGFQGKMNPELLGQWGSNSEAATKDFQRASGLPQTGVPDAATQAAMLNRLLSTLNAQKAVDSQKVMELEGIVNERNQRLKAARRDIIEVAERLTDGI